VLTKLGPDASNRVQTHTALILPTVAYIPTELPNNMIRNSTKKRTVLKNFQAEAVQATNYPHRLNFYTAAPLNEITIEEFELWAIDRLYG
jgi:hypothetical protein